MNSRTKGAAGERELRDELRRLFPHLDGIRRGQQYNGLDGQDVVGLPGVHIECKRVEKLNVDAAIAQAERDASFEQVPVVFHRRNRKPWLVTLRLDDVPAFAMKVMTYNETAAARADE